MKTSIVGFHSSNFGSLNKRDDSVLAFPALVAVSNLIWAYFAGATWPVMAGVFFYLLLPPVLMYYVGGAKNRPNLKDAGVLVVMAVIPMLLGKRFGGRVDLPAIAVSAALQGIFIWKNIRGMDGINIWTRPKLADLKWFGIIAFFLPLFLLDLSLFVGFPVAKKPLLDATNIFEALRLIGNSMLSWEFWQLWLRKALVTAFVEEVLFRSLVQNFLQKRFGENQASLVAAGCLFGLSHLGHGATSLINPLGWNWPYIFLSAVAGYGLGLLYQKTRSLQYGMAVHAMIDSIARTLYVFR